jgi:hypothetical protein
VEGARPSHHGHDPFLNNKDDKTMPNQAFVGRQEILGADEIVGASLKSLATAPLKLVKKAVTLPFDAAEWAMRRSPVPNKSWFIGKDEILGAFVGDEDRTMSEDSRSARDAGRRVASCGYNSHWNFIRGDGPGITAADLAKVQKLAEGGSRKAKKLLARLSSLSKSEAAGDAGPKPDAASERRQAKQILTAASESKAISRDALRRAIRLYAGASSTEADRTSVGRKMIALLNERQVRLTN